MRSSSAAVTTVTVRGAGLAGCLVVAVLASTSPLVAQENQESGRELGWFLSAELSFVMASGNAEATTLGAGASVRLVWERGRWRLETGGLRTRSTDTSRRAIGTADDFVVQEESESALTSENYHARTRFDRSLSERLFVYGGTSWVRNVFTGIDARWTLVGGGGLSVWETERSHFAVDLGGTYTVENPRAEGVPSQEFAGIRFSWDYGRRFTEVAEFRSVLVVDENLDDSDDLRGDFTNAITVSISEVLALRTSLQLLYDAQPAFEEVPLFTPAGDPTGETVLAALGELDTQLTLAIVFKL